MGRDLANGRIELTPLSHCLKVDWDVPGNLPLYSVEERFSGDVAKALRGVLGYNPLWKYLRQPVSVHNLGGCVMADHASQGVTDGYGEVFGYPNLVVMDGACLPEATGVNPSSTIAAVAERNIEHYIRRRTGKPGWQPQERRHATRFEDPLDRIVIPRGGTRPPQQEALGLTFTETMGGYISAGNFDDDAFELAARAGELAGSRAQFTLTISFPDFEAFMADRSHAGNASGSIRVDGITGPQGVPVRQGLFNLFVPSDSFYARRMVYVLPFYGTDGKPYLLDGHKDVRDDGVADVWKATTTLYASIRAGHDRSGPIVASGILWIRKRDFARQLTTIRATGPGTALERADVVTRFGKFFLGNLVHIFIRPHFE
jgi:cholesterol oxidase